MDTRDQRHHVVSYWCLPCEEDAASYLAVIKALAAAQGAPRYVPHMTLGAFEQSLPQPDALVKSLKGLVLTPSTIEVTDIFTKALFVRFRSSDVLATARHIMTGMPGFRSGRAFDPHISLCYGTPPEGSVTHRDVKALLSKPVRFDRLAAVNISLPVTTYADVSAWTLGDIYKI